MARPKLPDDKKRQQVNIRLLPNDLAELLARSERTGLRIASLAEHYLSIILARPENDIAILEAQIEVERAERKYAAAKKRLESFEIEGFERDFPQ